MLTTVVLIAAPAAPLMVAKAKAWSTTIVGNQFAIKGAVRNVRNPIANPIVPKIASTDILAILSHC
ncbi:MAG: hypothetical protein AUJ08_01920 [Thaumarchaeota archaeon 13_1_40CM_3_50_5]|nr:MAG: hypothetical protein AUH71_00620 [Thaumarchaeota archaeon 13_1_40CM_4_48_7]OLC86419.1 MAG: hypothetical protein AUJ08_01920 [Thaumarchaeota archaeon 13_1_40CM_3_50_5]